VGKEQNLKPWQKGVSGNPNGRPKGRTVRSALRQYLAQPNPETEGETREETAARKLWETGDKNPAFLLDFLKWLEGSSPKESSPEEEPETQEASDEELDGWARSQGYIKADDRLQEPGGFCGTDQQGTVDESTPPGPAEQAPA